MRIVAISDTHARHDALRIPDGDVLIHAGDMSTQGTLDELRRFNEWLSGQPHPTKVFVPGNHDFCFETDETKQQAFDGLTAATCLIDEALTVAGKTLWGAPWQPKFFGWAFNRERGTALREKWELIPDSTDILITHGPPRGIGDTVVSGEQVGCRELKKRVRDVAPACHVFGHIHEGYGRYERNGSTLVNASICDVRHHPRNQPIVIDL